MAPGEPVIIAESAGVAVDSLTIRKMRGSLLPRTDLRFIILVILSLLVHGALVYKIRTVKLKPVQPMKLEQIPERFAKLILEKPLPKPEAKKPQTKTAGTETKDGGTAETIINESGGTAENLVQGSKITARERAVAQKKVAARIARVESKIRTVGVLGMLTGVGSTAKGPAVVDVLGTTGARKERSVNLDQELANMTGLVVAKNVEVTQRKLVKSKDVEVEHKEAIDDLIAGVTVAKTNELAKRGEIIIQKPESIEGAASSNAKRDNNAINAAVSSHKASIKMSYEKYLKRNPTLAGKITIHFTITAAGTVSMVKVLDNTTGDMEFEQELVRKVKMWQFDPINEGDVTVTYPFVFTPS